MTEQLSVAEVLERAADLIKPEGRWIQGRLAATFAGDDATYDRADCWCAAGAALAVAHGYDVGPSSDPIWDALNAVCAPTRPGQQQPIAEFNDAPGRTQAEVVAKLREAARAAKATTPDSTPSVGIDR